MRRRPRSRARGDVEKPGRGASRRCPEQPSRTPGPSRARSRSPGVQDEGGRQRGGCTQEREGGGGVGRVGRTLALLSAGLGSRGAQLVTPQPCDPSKGLNPLLHLPRG